MNIHESVWRRLAICVHSTQCSMQIFVWLLHRESRLWFNIACLGLYERWMNNAYASSLLGLHPMTKILWMTWKLFMNWVKASRKRIYSNSSETVPTVKNIQCLSKVFFLFHFCYVTTTNVFSYRHECFKVFQPEPTEFMPRLEIDVHGYVTFNTIELLFSNQNVRKYNCLDVQKHMQL